MGEEEKKPEEKKMEEKQPEEPKKPDEKKEESKAEKPSEDKKEDKKAEEPKDPPPPPPPPPPQEIVLRVYMHCEGCARKVRRCLKNFEGVEEVETDCKTHKVVVKGAKADPVKVLEMVQRKSHRQVELLSPIPKPPAPEDAKKADEKEVAKPVDKKQEPQVITVVLKVYMHCEACSQEIKRRILRMSGVESVEPDLKSSQVTVKGVLDPPKLVEYVYKRTGKQALIVKQEAEKKVEEEKKADDGGAKDTGKGGEAAMKEKKDGGGEAAAVAPPAAVVLAEGADGESANVVELKKNEFYYNYPHNYQINPYPDPDPYLYPYPNTNPYTYPNTNPYPYPYPEPTSELYAYPPQHVYPPPQMFSDENPNACSVM